MKNEKGITLISLIIYVILMTFVVAGVSAITSSFYNNMNEFDKTSESATSFAKFNMYFLNDIKAESAKIAGNSNSKNMIELSYKTEKGTMQVVTYSMEKGSLYRDRVKICDKVKDLKFETNKTNGIIEVYMKIDNFEKTTTYKIEPKMIDDSSTVI